MSALKEHYTKPKIEQEQNTHGGNIPGPSPKGRGRASVVLSIRIRLPSLGGSELVFEKKNSRELSELKCINIGDSGKVLHRQMAHGSFITISSIILT